MQPTKRKVLVALSGGVDSALAAWRLREQGEDVATAYMKNWINEENVFGNCPWEQDIEDASAVAAHLGVPFEVANFMQDYRDRVVAYLVDGYQRGLTPNPDVMCNREMKFGVLRDWAQARGFTHVATGHYVRKIEGVIHEGVDQNKDQSYFLAMMRRAQVDDGLFPIGDLQKPEVRALARQAGLPNAEKKDSQGICFIGEVKINDFLEKFIPDRPGEIVNLEGRVLGEHRGLHRYTIGQRRGIGVPSNADNEFYVVVAKDLTANRLVVAFESARADALWHDRAELYQLNWQTPHPPQVAEDLTVRVRYRDDRVAARLIPTAEDRVRRFVPFIGRLLCSAAVCFCPCKDRAHFASCVGAKTF